MLHGGLSRLRILWAILRCPAAGLDELLESAQSIRRFYLERQAYVPPADLEPVERVVTVVERLERPVFYLDDGVYPSQTRPYTIHIGGWGKPTRTREDDVDR